MKPLAALMLLLVGCTPGSESGSLSQLPDLGGDDDDDDATSGDDDDDDDDDAAPAPVFVNELMADNRGSIFDNAGLPSDWIELYNPGPTVLGLDGWSLSDDWTNPTRHLLADGLVVPADGHLLLWASGAPDGGDRHLGFRLSSQGESVGIFDPDGEPVDWVTFAPQQSDWALARVRDGDSEWEEIAGGSPGGSNG